MFALHLGVDVGVDGVGGLGDAREGEEKEKKSFCESRA